MEKNNAQQEEESPSKPPANDAAGLVKVVDEEAKESILATAATVGVSSASSADPPPPPPPPIIMTKSGLKKMRRLERMMDKRKEKKERKKQLRREKAMALGRNLEQERQENEARAAVGQGRRIRQANWDAKMVKCKNSSSSSSDNNNNNNNNFQVAIDCAYEDQMTYKEINSLAQQLRYCYASNKKSPRPCLLAATSVGVGVGVDGTSTTLQLLQKVSGYENWGKRAFTITSQSLEEYYASRQLANDVVYLTSDAETVLQTLDDNKIYIIGGIVDRNRLKKAAYTRAQALGVAMAKLPLDDYMQMQNGATPILTCNHVFDILMHFKEHGNWQDALLSVLPPRKGAKPVTAAAAVVVPPPAAAAAASENNNNNESSSPKVAATAGSSISKVDGKNGLPMDNETEEEKSDNSHASQAGEKSE